MELYVLKENLYTMGRVRINDKLIISNNVIKINKPSIFRPLYRIMFKHNRVKTYVFLIKLIET